MSTESSTTSDVSNLPTSILSIHQHRTFGPRSIVYCGKPAQITADVRYDDQCKNGYNTFSITGKIHDGSRDGVCGCIHEEIAKAFPELAPFIKWHLTGTTGPMHYIENTIYFASDKDYRGLRKGETRQLKNGRTGHPVWEIVIRDSTGKKVNNVMSNSWIDLAEQPAEIFSGKYEPVLIVGEGKDRQLDVARNVAIWPEISDDELVRLCDSGELKQALLNRLPAVMAEFKQAVESFGFVY